MKKKTAHRRSGRTSIPKSPPFSSPQTHTHIHLHSTSSSSHTPPPKRPKLCAGKSLLGKLQGEERQERTSNRALKKMKRNHTSHPSITTQKSTPHASGKISQKTKSFVLHDTREPTNLESLEFKNKFHKTHSHFDPSRFYSCAFYEFHKDVLLKRHLCPSYLVNLENLATKGINFSSLFDALKWTLLVHIQKLVYSRLVRKFYANMLLIDGSIHSYIKRVYMTLNPQTISADLGYEDEGPKVYMIDKWDDQVGVTQQTVLQHICANLSGLDELIPTHQALGPENSLLHRIITHILTPQSGSHHRVTVSDSIILFALVTSSPISFTYIMIRHMWEAVKSTKKANLPYGMFLTCIFEYFKVDLFNEAVENKVLMIKGGGVSGKKSKHSMPSEPSLSDLESHPPEPSKVTASIREVLNEFLNMSKLMVQFHKAARKLAYENEKAWRKCHERVGFMVQSFEDEMGTEDKEEDSESEFNLSDD